MKKRGFIGPLVLLLVLIALGIGFYLFRSSGNDLARNNYVITQNTASTTENGIATSSISNTIQNETQTVSAPKPATSQKATAKSTARPVGLPNTGNVTSQSTPVPFINTGVLSVFLPGDIGPWVPGSLHGVTWAYNGTIATRAYSEFTVELIEPNRLDRGPLLLARYNLPLSSVPNYMSWTVPTSYDANDWYAIRVTYKTSDKNDFGSNFSGATYVGVSPYFKITPQAAGSYAGNATISNTTQPGVTTAVEKETIPLVRFTISAPASEQAVITSLAVGSPVGNEVFNYVENLKATINGTTIPLSFINEYMSGTTIWKLATPLTIAANTSVTVTLQADVKPGLHNASFTMAVKGGQGNVNVVGSVTGQTVTVR